MSHRTYRTLLLALALLLAAGTFGSVVPRAAAAPASPADSGPFRYFKETGHNIGTRIKAFYEQNGGIPIFGLPLTEVVREGNLEVQYFERARFELHPEFEPAFYVSITQLGRSLIEGRTEPAFAPQLAENDANTTYFPQTGHSIRFGFRAFWLKNGGLPIFGYPLSEEFTEVSPDDGKEYTVQYFERIKLEYHPEDPQSQIKLSRLGAQALDRSGLPESVRRPVPAISLLSTATTGYFGSIAERVNNIARGAARMNGLIIAPGATFSFNNALGSAGTEDGFVEGYAIVNGQLEKVTGGGICQISTTMYRAVFNAGLDIVDRRPHSYVINFYENIDGFDATVFAPYVDFKWRNDTGGPIYMMAATNPKAATVTFWLYGFNDGRKTQMVGPFSKNVKRQGIANWQYDPSLKRGQVIQLVHGRPGKDVEMQRIVTAANGKILHKDNLSSKYRPWEDFYAYGPGVTPPKGVNIIPAKTKAKAPSR
ncbi:MAG TPA: VanW family protein [Herpetosiphonaceae bacterium]